MCLTSLKSKIEVDEIRDVLPEVFSVWKCVRKDGMPEYYKDEDDGGEDDLSVVGIHAAGNFKGGRSRVTYDPGFHAFFSQKAAMDYQTRRVRQRLVAVEFRVRSEWLRIVGYSCVGGDKRLICGVFDHIEVI